MGIGTEGRVEALDMYCAHIVLTRPAKFWFHALRDSLITVTDRDLLLPRSLTEHLVNHAQPGDVIAHYAAN